MTARRTTTRPGPIAAGVLAGLAGSSALNAVAYLDMTVRARPASTTPEETARRIAEVAGVSLGPEPQAANRRSGLGPLLGYAAAVATAVTYAAVERRDRVALPLAAAVLGVGAMVAADAPMAGLRVTDPRRWGPADWISDLVPHLAFGAATALTLRLLRGRGR